MLLFDFYQFMQLQNLRYKHTEKRNKSETLVESLMSTQLQDISGLLRALQKSNFVKVGEALFENTCNNLASLDIFCGKKKGFPKRKQKPNSDQF